MTEKDMVIDVLSSVKSGIASYAKCITECSCPNLRSTFQQMRDGDEKFQYDLYKAAEARGFYEAAPEVTQKQRTDVRSFLSEQAEISFS